MASGLTWTQAKELADSGKAIRRHAWTKWIWLAVPLLWKIRYYEGSEVVERLVRAGEFGAAEFDAVDWTDDAIGGDAADGDLPDPEQSADPTHGDWELKAGNFTAYAGGQYWVVDSIPSLEIRASETIAVGEAFTLLMQHTIYSANILSPSGAVMYSTYSGLGGTATWLIIVTRAAAGFYVRVFDGDGYAFTAYP